MKKIFLFFILLLFSFQLSAEGIAIYPDRKSFNENIKKIGSLVKKRKFEEAEVLARSFYSTSVEIYNSPFDFETYAEKVRSKNNGQINIDIMGASRIIKGFHLEDVAETSYRLSLILAINGKYEEAKQYAKQAVYIKPNNMLYKESLDRILEMMQIFKK
ncbi:MAG: hypothetical protein R3B60_02000 [Candidatus Paceibacterota bacterium]